MQETRDEKGVRVNRRDLFRNTLIALTIPIAARGVELANRVAGNGRICELSWWSTVCYRIQQLFQKPPPPLGPPGSIGLSADPRGFDGQIYYDAGGQPCTAEDIEAFRERFRQVAMNNSRTLKNMPQLTSVDSLIGHPSTWKVVPIVYDERMNRWLNSLREEQTDFKPMSPWRKTDPCS